MSGKPLVSNPSLGLLRNVDQSLCCATSTSRVVAQRRPVALFRNVDQSLQASAGGSLSYLSAAVGAAEDGIVFREVVPHRSRHCIVESSQVDCTVDSGAEKMHRFEAGLR